MADEFSFIRASFPLQVDPRVHDALVHCDYFLGGGPFYDWEDYKNVVGDIAEFAKR